MSGPDAARIDAVWRTIRSDPSARDVTLLRERCAAHDDLAHAYAVRSLTGWPLVRLGPSGRFTALSPSGAAWLPEGRKGLPRDLAAALLAAAPDGSTLASERAARFGDDLRARHRVAEAAVDVIRLFDDVIRPFVTGLPDGIEGKAAPEASVPEGPPAWFRDAAEALSGKERTHVADGSEGALEGLIDRLGRVSKGEQGYRDVVRALEHADPAALPRIVNVALIRSTWMYRGVLPDAWYGFRDRMRDDCESKGEDVGKVMRGLLDPRPEGSVTQDLAVLSLSTGRSHVARLADCEEERLGPSP